ncbi:MAG: relaxase [Hyphomonas sp.]|uniref:relaxase/mobilization nuclease domain-containing protein n=1 Tax=Hyphomonas sp. TaxID=87 RepID=UPI001E1941C8|nr:hypothetical protein [Hyphomonas sp.]MBA4226217.1 relaxase [Hyphomonas sp.]
MIIKASQRGSGVNLAAHLTRTDENEHVHIAELRGFVGENLHDAFKEVDAIRRGTKCQQYLFSVSLSPPSSANLSVEDFMAAIDRVEEITGLNGQPRTVVFHEKEGRRHAHAVWSRIDASTMTAKPLPFFKNKMMEVSREQYLQHGYPMPRGMTKASERDPTNFSLAEYQRAKRRGEDPRAIKMAVQDAWAISDGRKAFENALEARGIALAKGDKRALVIIDHNGEVHALSRTLDLKTKDLRAKLGEPTDLKSVAEAQKQIAERMTPAIRRHIEESRTAFQKRSAKLAHYKMEMTHLHRKERTALDTRLNDEWTRETLERQARLPRGLKGLWSFFTGKTGEIKRQNQAEALATQQRHALERHQLIERQLGERRILQAKFQDHRKMQTSQLKELRRDIGRYFKLARQPDPPQTQARSNSLSLKLDQ